jgi:hypothetical protein
MAADKVFRDWQGLKVRLTVERLDHIMEHPEMTGMERAIEETLAEPEEVLESLGCARREGRRGRTRKVEEGVKPRGLPAEVFLTPTVRSGLSADAADDRSGQTAARS